MAGVNITIGADSKKAERELKSFQRKTKGIASSIAKGFKERIGHRLFDGLLGAARSIPGAMKEMIDAGGKLSDQIARTGAAGEGLVVLERALKNNGIAATKMDDILRKMQDSFSGLNKEQKSTVDAYDLLGLSMSELRKLDPVDALKRISKAFGGLSSNADKTAAALDIFGRSGSELITLFEDQTAFQQAEKELGSLPTLLTKNAGKLDTLSDRFGNMDTAFKTMALSIAIELIPVIDKVTKTIQDMDLAAVGRKVSAVIKLMLEVAPAIAGITIAIKGIQLAKFFATMATGLMGSIGLWGAETVAVKANTAAKLENAGAGAAAARGGGVMGKLPGALAAAGVAVAGFSFGEMIGDKLADVMIDEGPSEIAGDSEAFKNFNAQKGRSSSAIAEDNAKFRERMALEEKAAQAAARKVKEAKKAQDEAAAKAQSIRDSYKDTMVYLQARLSGNKELLTQLDREKKITEEQRNHAAQGMILARSSAEKIVAKREEIEAKDAREAASSDEAALIFQDKKDRLGDAENQLGGLTSQSSNLAVSSMQRIGGGGGSYGQLDLQKRQADLQSKIVDILTAMKADAPVRSVSQL